MARHLTKQGYRAHTISYSSTLDSLDRAGLKIANKAKTLHQPHLLGHSLGGLVVLNALSHLAYPGRAVLLGTPLQGSRIAHRLTRLPGGKKMLGVARTSLTTPAERPPEHWQVGLIAGSARVGTGALLGGTRFAGDGTVADEESDAPWLTDRIVLRQSHTSLQLTRGVAEMVHAFLQTGRFD